MRAGFFSSSWVSPLLDALYPKRCVLCDVLGDEPICSICLDSFVPRSPVVFRAYGPAELDFWGGIYLYEGRAAQAVQRLKYERATSLATPLAQALSKAAADEGLLEVHAIVPVPIHWSRRSIRGFNQSELLCEQMPASLVRPGLLRRTRNTRPQVGLSEQERLENLKGAFQATDVEGLRILLIDDVLTSGQTARECALALKRSGAVEVGILTFAAADPE